MDEEQQKNTHLFNITCNFILHSLENGSRDILIKAIGRNDFERLKDRFSMESRAQIFSKSSPKDRALFVQAIHSYLGCINYSAIARKILESDPTDCALDIESAGLADIFAKLKKNELETSDAIMNFQLFARTGHWAVEGLKIMDSTTSQMNAGATSASLH